MIDFDRETWIYLTIITLIIIYFIWNSNRASKNKKARKNRNFRHRYFQRKKKETSQKDI